MSVENNRFVTLDHFKNLVAVAVVDGFLDDDEKVFLEERAEELGLPHDQVHSVIENADKLEFVPPETEEDKDEQLADVVYMSMVDGEIEDKEYDLCLHVAERMGMQKSDLDHVISLTRRLWD
ncbi:MAG: hypothetical protein AAFX87_01185 [Bacteroidota bacterium]